jgi:hypothetical protein
LKRRIYIRIGEIGYRHNSTRYLTHHGTRPNPNNYPPRLSHSPTPRPHRPHLKTTHTLNPQHQQQHIQTPPQLLAPNPDCASRHPHQLAPQQTPTHMPPIHSVVPRARRANRRHLLSRIALDNQSESSSITPWESETLFRTAHRRFYIPASQFSMGSARMCGWQSPHRRGQWGCGVCQGTQGVGGGYEGV